VIDEQLAQGVRSDALSSAVQAAMMSARDLSGANTRSGTSAPLASVIAEGIGERLATMNVDTGLGPAGGRNNG
jgi:hypothetical protein